MNSSFVFFPKVKLLEKCSWTVLEYDQFLNRKRAFLELSLKFSHRSFQLLCTLVKMHTTDNCLIDRVGMHSIDLSRNQMHFVNCLESITKSMRSTEALGRVVNLRSRGRWVEAQVRRCIVYLSRTFYPLLRTGSTQVACWLKQNNSPNNIRMFRWVIGGH